MGMVTSTINEKVELIVKKAGKSDGIILAAGVGALILGILVDVFIVRLLCLFLVTGSAAITVALIRARRLDPHAGSDKASSQSYSQISGQRMMQP